jgi:hypothetical protein
MHELQIGRAADIMAAHPDPQLCPRQAHPHQGTVLVDLGGGKIGRRWAEVLADLRSDRRGRNRLILPRPAGMIRRKVAAGLDSRQCGDR